MQMANLWLLCSDAVAKYVAPTFEAANGKPFPPDQQQSATSCLFIQATREGLQSDMPTGTAKHKPQDANTGTGEEKDEHGNYKF